MLGPAPTLANGNGTGSVIPPQPQPIEQTPQQRENTIMATGQQPAEPAVLTSEHVDEAINDGKQRLTQLAQKGATTGENGALYADGSAVPTPTQESNPGKYSVDNFYGDGTAQNPGDADWQAAKNLFAPLKAQLDANTLANVHSIESQFDSLRQMTQEANASAAKSSLTSLLNVGTSRYSPFTASGITLANTIFGIQKIKQLDADENAAIAKAQEAQQTGDSDLMMKSIDMAETARKAKQDQAQKVLDTIQTANKKMADATRQASRDTAVAGLIGQGVTDPAQILKYLNKYDDGTPTGGDFSADEVGKTLSSLTVDGNSKNLPADIATFNYIKKNFGLPPEISALPEGEQYFGYLAAIKKANTAPSTGTNGGYTALEQRKLRQAGINPSDTSAADDFLYGKTSTSDGTTVPSWDDYKAAAAKTMGVNYLMSADEDKLKEQYDTDFGQYNPGDKLTPFTSAEKQTLEQAGLLKATRKEQLDFLEKKTESSDVPDFLQ